MKLLLAYGIVLGLLLTACGGSDTSDLQQQIDELRQENEELRASIEQSSGRAIVRHIFEDEGAYCSANEDGLHTIGGGEEATYIVSVEFVEFFESQVNFCVSPESQCADEARVGYALPRSCGSP